jgi:hypothetical protein
MYVSTMLFTLMPTTLERNNEKNLKSLAGLEPVTPATGDHVAVCVFNGRYGICISYKLYVPLP